MTENREVAVVTGASSGIGFELARQFAEQGFDLIVNSADAERLRSAAEEIGRLTGAEVQPIRADLRSYEEAEHFVDARASTGRPVAVAALNAGVGEGGAFLDTDLKDEFEIIDLNVRSTVHLAKRRLRSMAAAGEGRMLITSSIASTMPGPFQAVYNASKSFLQSIPQALQNELKAGSRRAATSRHLVQMSRSWFAARKLSGDSTLHTTVTAVLRSGLALKVL